MQDQSALYVFKIIKSAEEENLGVRGYFSGLSGQIDPVHKGHLNIRQQYIHFPGPDDLQGIFSVRGLFDLKTVSEILFQKEPDDTALGRFVIHGKYPVHFSLLI